MKPACQPLPVSGRRGFSLLEILVAVTLLVVIITGLLFAFQQTQRAMRSGLNQSDVLESGRATLALIAQQLQEMAQVQTTNGLNFYVGPASPGGVVKTQTLPDGSSRTNVLQEFFFHTRYNDEWHTMKYGYCDEEWNDGAATLFLKSGAFEYSLVSDTNFSRMAPFERPDICTNLTTYSKFRRVMDGVVHLRVRAYSASGQLTTNTWPYILVQTNLPGPDEFYYYEFYNRELPAYVDVELGVLERRTLEQFNGIAAVDSRNAANFLTRQAGRVHLFRQRVPIRTEQRVNP